MEHAENDRGPRVVVEEADHHFVADLGADHHAPVVAGVGAGDPRPHAVAGRVYQRQAHTHAEFVVRVLVVGDHADLQAVGGGQQAGGAAGFEAFAAGRVFGDAAELQVGAPALAGVHLVAHGGEHHLAVETRAHAGQLDHVAGLHLAEADAHGAPADLVETGAGKAGVGGGGGFAVGDHYVAQFEGIHAHR